MRGAFGTLYFAVHCWEFECTRSIGGELECMRSIGGELECNGEFFENLFLKHMDFFHT